MKNSADINKKITINSYSVYEAERLANIQSWHTLVPVKPRQQFRPDLVEFTVDSGRTAGDHAGKRSQIEKRVQRRGKTRKQYLVLLGS